MTGKDLNAAPSQGYTLTEHEMVQATLLAARLRDPILSGLRELSY